MSYGALSSRYNYEGSKPLSIGGALTGGPGHQNSYYGPGHEENPQQHDNEPTGDFSMLTPFSPFDPNNVVQL